MWSFESGMITLAIPNRNGARYLESTLRSLCSGSNRGVVRWWLQDCCSQDGSPDIAERYRSDRDVIRICPDTGQANGLNRAFAEMGGEIVGYLNSDDCLAEGAATAVCNAFENNPEVDVVFGAVQWIDVEGRTTGHHQGMIVSFEEALDIYEFWWNSKQWVQPEVFFRRKLYDLVGGFDERFELSFDFDFWLRILRLRPVVMAIPQTVALFRRHNQQRSLDFEKANREIRLAVGRQLDDDTCPITPRFRARVARMLRYDLYQNGSDLSPLSGLSFAKALLRSPDWVLLPEVRRRILSSVGTHLGKELRHS